MYLTCVKITALRLHQLFTLTIALSLGFMVGLSLYFMKTVQVPLVSGVMLREKYTLTTSESFTRSATDENGETAIYVNSDNVRSWVRKSKTQNGGQNPDLKVGSFDCNIKETQALLYGEDRKFQGLPDVFRKNKIPPKPFPGCGRFLPWRLMHEESWMIFVVKTAPSHVERRNVIRRTWGSLEVLRGKRFATLFLLGNVKEEEEDGERLLQEENALYGDMLQCDFADSYTNLPIKVLSAFRWLLEGHMTSQFYTVTDDDCVMNLMNIVTYFHYNASDERGVLCGFLYDQDLRTIRKIENKWGVGFDTYDQAYYPTFCHGGMWTVRKQMLKDLYCMAEVTDRNGFYLEDVYITGILREKMGEHGSNIRQAITRSGRKYELMYYPWDETERATLKMEARWRRWNKTLPWNNRIRMNGMPIISTRPPNDIIVDARLASKWRMLDSRFVAKGNSTEVDLKAYR